MKKLLFAALLSLSIPAIAQEDKFEDKKAKMISHLEKRIANLNEAKTCVSGAADKEALKGCHAKLKEDRMEMREDMKEKREQWKSKKEEWKKKKE